MPVGINAPNKADVLAVLEALKNDVHSFHEVSLWKVAPLMLFLGFQIQLGVLGSSFTFSRR